MKSIFLIVVYISLFNPYVLAQNVEWIKYYDSQQRGELVFDARVSNDDIFIISDIELYTNSRHSEEIILNVRRINKDGNLLWSKEINPDSLNRFKAYKITEVNFYDNKIYISGYCKNNSGLNSYFVSIISIEGTLIYRNVFYFNKQHYLLSINYKNSQVLQILFNTVDGTPKFYQYNLLLSNPYVVLSIDSVNYLQPINVRYVDSLVCIFNVDRDVLGNLELTITKLNNNLSLNSEMVSKTNIQLHPSFSTFHILEIMEKENENGWILRGQFRGVYDNPNISGFEMDNYVLVTNKEGELTEQYYFNKNNQDSYSISTESHRILYKDAGLFVTHKIKYGSSTNDYRYRVCSLKDSQKSWEYNVSDPSGISLLSSFPITNLNSGSSIISINQLPQSRTLISQFFSDGGIYREWEDAVDTSNLNGVVSKAVFLDGYIYLVGLNTLNNRVDADIMLRKIGADVLGLNEQVENEVKVFPNPFNSYIEINNFKDTVGHIELYNIQGKLILQENIKTKINTSNLDAGLYFMHLNSREESCVIKLIKH